MFGSTVLTALLAFGGKFIEDKDKKTEFAFKVMETMLAAKTYPWVDALVKLSFASEQIVKGLFRPIGAMAMTAFAMYCSHQGIELDTAAQTMLYGAFPAWGASRYSEKKSGTDKKTEISWDEI